MTTHHLFSGTVNLLERAMDLRSKRHNLLVSNVVNQDTPHYKAFDTEMDDAFRRLASTDESMALYRTHPGHMGAEGSPGDSQERHPRVMRSSVHRADGNTVDIEDTMVNMASNTIMYNAMSQIISKKFAKLKNVILGGKS